MAITAPTVDPAALVARLQTALKTADARTAVQLAEELVRLMPGNEDAARLLAGAKLAAYDLDGGLRLLRDLPDDPLSLLALARFAETGAQRRAYLKRALQLAPDDDEVRQQFDFAQRFPEHRMGAAAAALRAGDLTRGFGILARLLRELKPPSDAPYWQGQPVGRLVIIGSGGDGDLLQFVRYLPAAAARCDRLVVGVRPSMVGLLRQNGFDACDGSVLAQPALLRDADAQCDVMMLPALVGGGYARRGGYLRAAAPRDFGPGVHIGVNWVASNTPDGRRRTVDPEMLAPLARVPGVTFHCLVFGERARAAPGWMQPLQLGDYTDTANAYAGLDLVISVDSGPAHLAGALGVPLWVALPGPHVDWRFETHAHKWRWYDRSRLFRGRHCFEAMAAMLPKWLRSGLLGPRGA